ncbi:Oligopeptidase A [Quillaja saponaria]|uniref:oligopeptidase A n=1 Tax=Quillaja saponaria TaxID=32244 RepID=A0AAD7KY05_QUISA|nr:Oligopeptidase A [Quillaja saponaria]
MASDSQNNPLLEDFVFPPYDVIEPKHVRPAIRSLLKKLESDLAELETTLESTWPKLVEPLERITDRLSVVWGIVNHLNAVKDSPELRSAIEEVQPEKVKFQLGLAQSKPIYAAFKAIRDSSNWESLSVAQKRIVEAKIKEAVLNGISLEADKREKYNEIEQDLERLGQKFEENILDATKNFEKLITEKKDVEGLPATALAMAAKMALSKGYEVATTENGPWILTLDGPSYRSILKLRLEKAKLLGYNNYAEVSMQMKMATVDQAEELIEELRNACWNHAIQDMEKLKIFARGLNSVEANELNHWDINFWSERIRESKYNINEEELRPFCSLPTVIAGLFSLAKMLFAIDIDPADGLAPVWNSDVRFYHVKDHHSMPIAYFYFDPYTRPSEKRGGAWVDGVYCRSRALSPDGTSPRLPVVHIVCNQTPPLDGKPSLMTFREVEALFHEFGHALQHMLTKQDEGFVSGTRGIEFDAVELPSQFMENWCYQRDTLMSIAKHYDTGENLSEELCMKLLSARTFRAGSLILRQLRYASVDLELHTSFIPGGSESVFDVDQRVGRRTHVIPLLLEDRFLCSFSHIFSDVYAAGYYSYQWAEVLSADAFSAFEEAGLNNNKVIKEMGLKFRESVLSLGGGKSPLEVFIEFRGREPSPEAFLRYNGLVPAMAAI